LTLIWRRAVVIDPYTLHVAYRVSKLETNFLARLRNNLADIGS